MLSIEVVGSLYQSLMHAFQPVLVMLVRLSLLYFLLVNSNLAPLLMLFNLSLLYSSSSFQVYLSLEDILDDPLIGAGRHWHKRSRSIIITPVN
jgi:hypothetical protein